MFQHDKIREAFSKNTLNFEYRLVDLNKITEDELDAQPSSYVAFPYALKMIWALATNTEPVLQSILLKAESMPDADHKVFIQKLWNYCRLKYPDLVTKEVMVKAATQARAKKAQKSSMTLEDCVQQQAEEIAMARGLEQGLEQGAMEAQREIVANLLAVMAPEKISKHCKLPLDVVLEVQRHQEKS